MTAAEAETAIVDNYASLERLARRIAPGDHEDVVQTTAEIMLRHCDKLRASEAHLWLHTVCKHEALRVVTQQSRRDRIWREKVVPLAHVTVEPDVDQLVDDQSVIASLSPRQRGVLVGQAAGFSHHELADHLGWTPRTVERQIRRGRAALRTAA